MDDDVRSLRSRLHKKTGLPAWQGVRLKCRLDLRDSYPVSAIDQTVQVMESGGVPGGAGAKRARNPLDSSDDEDSLETRGSPSSASPAASEAADDEGEEGARLVETASSDESEGEGEAEGEGPKYSPETREVLGEHKRRKSKLVALDDVKAKADDFIYAAIGRGISSIVEDEGANYNCLVLGESGVGKTTIVEELLYKPLKDLGVLTGEFVVKGPIELQKGKLKAALEEAEGGILFIDEAYGLGSSGATTTQLVGLLQSSGGNVMVVAAGYKGKMMEWLGTNEGLAARFPTLFDIPPPTADDLASIGVGYVQEQGFAELGEDALSALREAAVYIKSIPSEAKVPRNANAILSVVGKNTGAVMHFDAEMGRRGGGRVPDQGKVLTKEHIEAGLASFKARVSAMAGSSGSSGAAGSSGVTSSAPHDVMHQACGPAATRTCTALCPPNLAASHLEGHRAP